MPAPGPIPTIGDSHLVEEANPYRPHDRHRGGRRDHGYWNEILLDITTDAKRKAVADKVNAWIDGCATKGYKAIEPDNLDSWERSGGLITQQMALDYIGLPYKSC